MRNTVLFGLVALLSASTAAAQERPQGPEARANRGGQSVPSSSPSLIVAAETRFERLAIEKGLWRAFRETATEDAFSFTPNLQSVAEWLDSRKGPDRTVSWDPYHIIMSCDGTLAASRGAWTSADGSETGYYTTIWQRQKKGEYQWVFDHASTEAPIEGEANAVTSERGDCQRAPRRNDGIEGENPDGPPAAGARPPRGGDQVNGRGNRQNSDSQRSSKRRKKKPVKPIPVVIDMAGARKAVSGGSRDRSLIWEAIQWPDGTRTLNVEILKDGTYLTVINDERGAVTLPAGTKTP